MRVLISGGCKNGKSYIAQQIAKKQGHRFRYYIATMLPRDEEDQERVRRHRDERKDWGFTTVEAPVNLPLYTKDLDMASSFLLDSTTALLSNEMFHNDGQVNMDAGDKVTEEISDLVHKTERIVIVSDYIFGDYLSCYDELTRHYCKALAQVNRALASVCDTVMEITYGQITYHKGGEC